MLPLPKCQALVMAARFVQHSPPQKDGTAVQWEALGQSAIAWWGPLCFGEEHSSPLSSGIVFWESVGCWHLTLGRSLYFSLPPDPACEMVILEDVSSGRHDGWVLWGGGSWPWNVLERLPLWILSFPWCDQNMLEWVDGVKLKIGLCGWVNSCITPTTDTVGIIRATNAWLYLMAHMVSFNKRIKYIFKKKVML